MILCKNLLEILKNARMLGLAAPDGWQCPLLVGYRSSSGVRKSFFRKLLHSFADKRMFVASIAYVAADLCGGAANRPRPGGIMSRTRRNGFTLVELLVV